MPEPDQRFYVTTPIYYVNSKPHIGTSYTTIIADIACRFARFMGRETLLVTGSDEHSQNIVDLAAAQGKSPQQFCDEIVPSFEQAWKSLSIHAWRFCRTSDPAHHALVRTVFKRIYEKGDIYKGEYSGWYHTSDNRFLDADEVPENPESNPRLKFLTEEAYWFRLSRYQQWLLDFHTAREDFVIPGFRRNEMLARIEGGLKDTCISRTSTDWGVKLPWDEGHIFYVWMDALLTYVTGSGFDIAAYERTFSTGVSSEAREPLWETTRADLATQPAGNFWPCDLHIMAKDIPWFHAIIFPAVLASYGLPLPRQMLVHGYWNFGGEKMSKSVGNVVDPLAAIELVGVDGLRYFLAREVPLGLDGNFTHEALINRYNYDLANDLGNLIHRTVSMVHQLFDGTLPEELAVSATDDEMERARAQCVEQAVASYEALEYGEALQAAWELVGAANKYIDERKPWELKKKPERRDEISTVFFRLAGVIRDILLLASPVIPDAAARFWEILALPGSPAELTHGALGEQVPAGHQLNISEPLFRRIEVAADEHLAVSAASPRNADPGAGRPGHEKAGDVQTPPIDKLPQAQTPDEPQYIGIDDFSKVELLVGEVRAAERVPKADRLLRLSVFDGARERQILAGIAQHYAPEELLGRQVVIVANLAPRTLRGLVSEGMVLAASTPEGALALVTPLAPIAPGGTVR